MLKKVLIIFEDNWADEMDLKGFDIISKAEWEYKKKELLHTEFPIEVGFGTNEENTYETREDFIKHFKAHEISEKEESTIKKFFGNWSFGHIPFHEGDAPDSFYEEHGFCPD